MPILRTDPSAGQNEPMNRKWISNHRRTLLQICLGALLLLPLWCRAGGYTNFEVSVYIPVNVVQSFADPQKLADDWTRISRQLKVGKVYIEVQRDRRLADDRLLEQVKKFFLDHGVKVAGGMALSDGSIGGQFKSFCYTDPKDRAFVKNAAELAARQFDEVIQDDFFFVNTKNESDIAAKGDKSWTQFRLELMDDVAENLIVKPAKAVNPKVKMVVKFPNWYEHFQGLGYDLDREPKIFDGIYTGTETRDPVITDQHLQAYESYQIIRYFDNVKPGGNGGGWVDTYSIRYVDRYAEQLWDTLFAKAPEITLFEWSALSRPIEPGDRTAWENLPTSFDFNQMVKAISEPTMARVAGYSLEQVDAFLGQLGNPIGVASYKPYQSTGEDFLHNYLGMIGIPIDLHPEFPTNASLVLLTESAAADPEIVSKIKGQLVAGKTVVITSGLLRALSGRGIEDIIEVRYTDRKFLAQGFFSGFGAGNGVALDQAVDLRILFPELDFLTNDAWPVVRALADGSTYPVLLMDRYAQGTLMAWTMPDNFGDLYRLPPSVTSAIKDQVMRDFPVRVDGPGQVALFAYDNHTFIVESYLPDATDVKVSLNAGFDKIKNLLTGEILIGETPSPGHDRWARAADESREVFNLHLPPHSYRVFKVETEPSRMASQ
jgi:hypothetical protein